MMEEPEEGEGNKLLRIVLNSAVIFAIEAGAWPPIGKQSAFTRSLSLCAPLLLLLVSTAPSFMAA